jgi:choline-glycine betaine transporter
MEQPPRKISIHQAIVVAVDSYVMHVAVNNNHMGNTTIVTALAFSFVMTALTTAQGVPNADDNSGSSRSASEYRYVCVL